MKFLLSCLVLIMVKGFALELELIQTLPSKLTQVNISSYDIYGNGSGATSFILNLKNSESKEYKNLRIEYEYVYKLLGESNYTPLFKGKSNYFNLNANETFISVTSNQFLTKDNPSVKFSKDVGVDLGATESIRNILLNKVLEKGTLLSGVLVIQARLLDISGKVISKDENQTEIFYASNVELIFPSKGSTIYNDLPQFFWNSDLLNNQYADYKEKIVFEIYLYEQKLGQSRSQALAKPVWVKESTVNSVLHGFDDKKLNSNSIYYWKVNGILRGAGKSIIVSDLVDFRYKKSLKEINPQVEMLLRQLEVLLSDPKYADILEVLRSYLYDVDGSIENKNVKLSEIQNFVNSISNGEINVEKIYFR